MKNPEPARGSTAQPTGILLPAGEGGHPARIDRGIPPGAGVVLSSGYRGEIVGRYGETDDYSVRVRMPDGSTLCMRCHRREIVVAGRDRSRQESACDDVVLALSGLLSAYGVAASCALEMSALRDDGADAVQSLASGLHEAAARAGLLGTLWVRGVLEP